MRQSGYLAAAAAAVFAILDVPTVLGQGPPTPTGITVVKSKYHPNVTISYKQNTICETTEGVKSYSGYVHLPPGTLSDTGTTQDYPINSFFWFFESRTDPTNAPLSIWMNGGPGSSSLIGLFQENGPCNVNDDSDSTRINPYSWNSKVNMLYFDEPVQTGFSYDEVETGILNNYNALVEGGEIDLTTKFTPEELSFTNATVYPGKFASGNGTTTANTTTIAAHAAWHFAQTFFGEFPEYTPNDKRISIWTESYGGRYGPAFTNFFEEQNAKIEAGTLKGDGIIDLHMDTLGIINGCIDLPIQEGTYPKMLWNNTYGIKVITDEQYESATLNWTKSGGGLEKVLACQNAVKALDAGDEGDSDKVNEICQDANDYVNNYVEGVFFEASTQVGYYDIAHPSQDPFPPEYYLGYLAKADVQQAIGVPINFTESSNGVYAGFTATGDYARGGEMQDLAYVLSRGVKVTLVYGDRDYACNWLGGQDVSMQLNYTDSAKFRAAGYANMVLNSTSPAYGFTRQYGNFSFTRVFESGHEVPAYQPEAALAIFERALFNKDIATGEIDISKNTTYTTEGPSDTWFHKNEVPPKPEPTCYVLSPGTCTDDQFAQVQSGQGLIKNYILQSGNTTTSGNSTTGGNPGHGNATSTYTTGLPTPTKTSAGIKNIANGLTVIVPAVLVGLIAYL